MTGTRKPDIVRLACAVGAALTLSAAPAATLELPPETNLLAQVPTGLAAAGEDCDATALEQNMRSPSCTKSKEQSEEVIILESDGSSEAAKLRRPPPAYGLGHSAPRPSGITPTVRRPSSTTRSPLTGPTPDHSAAGAIHTTQKERLFQDVIDRLDDGNAEVTIVTPSRRRPVAGSSLADQEINRAQQYQLFEKIRDRIEDADVIVTP